MKKIHTWKDGTYCLSVRDTVEITNNKAIYRLWSSPIVTVYKETDGKKIVNFCFCGYSSQTTKERISTILQEFAGCYISRRNWIHYLKMGNDYYRIDEARHYTVKDGILFDSIGNKVESLGEHLFYKGNLQDR